MLVICAVIELYYCLQCNVLINYCAMIVGCVGAAAVSDDDDVGRHVSDASQPTDAIAHRALHPPLSTPVVTGLSDESVLNLCHVFCTHTYNCVA